MADLRFLHFVRADFTDADLDSVFAVFFFCFYLGYLASVELDHCAGLEFAPFVPEVGAADFVAEDAGAAGEAVCFESGSEAEVLVDFFFERFKCLSFIHYTVFL